VAAVILAVFTLSFPQMGRALLNTFGDPSVLLLTFVVGLIPLIGGALEASGEMDRLVENLRIGRKPFLAMAPALLGMLPMPGGALLSAPLVERGAGDLPADLKTAANVWFRHGLLLVYPLGSSLIASVAIASLDLYGAILYLLPAFLVTLIIGYLILLRGTGGAGAYTGQFSLSGLLVPLCIILVAPALDLSTKTAFSLPYPEIGTAVGVTVSLLLAVVIGRLGPSRLKAVTLRMRPWRFAAIILAMFLFLNVFQLSGAPTRIAALHLSPIVLCVAIGFVLGLVTGRIQAPMSIVVPIFLTTYGAMSAPAFAVTYFAVYLGYLVTPIHPCVSVSVEYFGSSMPAYLRKMIVPVAVSLLVDVVAALFIL
jgi:uncharacterized protein